MVRRSPSSEDAQGWIGACPLFSDLEGEDREVLARIARYRSFERQETIFHQGEAAEGFHVVAHGRVKVCRFGGEGREQVLHVLDPGAPVGEVPVFQGSSFPATAVALEPCGTLYFSRSDFLELGKRYPEILLKMMAILSGRLRHFVDLVDDLALKEVSARLARHLLEQAGPGGDAVTLDTTKAVLAGRLGTIAETLSRTLARMQRGGLIAVDGNRIELIDRQGLEELISAS